MKDRRRNSRRENTVPTVPNPRQIKEQRARIWAAKQLAELDAQEREACEDRLAWAQPDPSDLAPYKGPVVRFKL